MGMGARRLPMVRRCEKPRGARRCGRMFGQARAFEARSRRPQIVRYECALKMDAAALPVTLVDLLAREPALRTQFLVALATFDGERRHLELGYPSCFAFLTDALGFSKASAFRRVTAARLLQKMPAIGAWLSR